MKGSIAAGLKLAISGVLFSLLLTAGVNAEALRIGSAVEPKSMDPQLTALGSDLGYYRHVYNALVEADESLRPQPGLAESWTVIDDTTYEFKLREGVRFHDGSAFDAEDVLYSFERLPTVPDGDGLTAAKLKSVSEIEVIDPHLIRIHTSTPDSGVLRALGQFFILPKELGEVATEDFNSGDAVIGTGPFKFDEWRRGDFLRFSRNPDYWGEAPQFDDVEFKMLSNSASRVAALRAGDVDLIDYVPPLDALRIKQDSDLNLFTIPAGRTILLLLDAKRDMTPHVFDKAGNPLKENPFKDKRVREAISKSIDRNLIVDKVMDGLAAPASQPMPVGFGGYADDLKVPESDVEAARALMAEAGYPEGFKMTLNCTSGRYINDTEVCQAIAQMVSRIGIEANVDALPPSAYFPEYKNAAFSAYILGWGNSSGDASSILTSVGHSADKTSGRGSWNHHYESAELDALIEQGLGTVDDEKREALYADAMRKIMEDVAMIPLHAQLVLVATQKNLEYRPTANEWTLAQNVSLAE
ncbi:ABC transporter substrate-binding protein [uncultured Hoeflea sp.]|uniref:ABC transporter substrate-binding protein n=1 Tax=uncultured Hoeflea sp. TaxID=538666 RepID=UPI00262D47FB|nr:ABC transporter substrate-binding protein [uncultured Hoeflea sp.]